MGEPRIIGAAYATQTCRALDGVSGSFDPREFLTQGRIHTTDIVQGALARFEPSGAAHF